ncbi:acyl-CoA dehydrogenase [Bosea sp. PAMC 26642]|uniref:acyl-CoA dehydrogenase n=1 Tax=Bosea sp. (strain PAMC 26642) TaxID=1792307 RepID=UPI00076FE92D|nr:acyl-CoA dehydrogenase [Bosea sp. PAMC 26642]AMJ61483.1 acyl-CoA dehydrogenase [Bosea sp. PAMC 26642]
MGYLDERDLAFLLYDWLGAQRLTAHAHFAEHSRETFDAVLDVSARLAASHFATHYKKADQTEPVLEGETVHVIPEIGQSLKAAAEMGLFAVDFASGVGGLQLPKVVQTASMAHFMAANIATAAYVMLTTANARLLCAFGTSAQIETFALPQIEGRWLGTMCLSEPQAGSSLADITTRAVVDGEDDLGPRYRMSGSKMWISGGDQNISDNIVHLVLAKIPDASGALLPGVGGISLFAVPKFLPDGTRNDIAVAGLNHKMGYRGTTNCLLNFGEGTRHRPGGEAGAIGYRIGEAGSGLALMFQMMNEARISVGLGAAALAVRGYRQSLAYARERPQGRPLVGGSKVPAAKQRPIVEHADVRRMLLAQKSYAEGALALILYCAELIDQETTAATAEDKARAVALLGLLTPVAKSWPSEFGLAANDMAIQIHGGYGYTRDFDVEQIYRDNRLNPIHEGTHGIQAIDLLGRKILRDREQALVQLAGEIERTAGRAASYPDLTDLAGALRQLWSEVEATIALLAALDDPARALINASTFLSAFGHVVVGWLWLDQACTIRAGGHGPDAFLRGKLRACRYFFEAELPKAKQQLAFVATLNATAGLMPLDEF